MSRASLPSVFVAALTIVALIPGESDAGEGACKDCKEKVAHWDWKANGYAVAATADGAKEAALARALELGCPAAYRYLDATKLSCDAGCTAGTRANACKPKVEPSCEVAQFEEHKEQWLFVCRKAKGKAAHEECTPEKAAVSPFYSMCDVPIAATATLSCGAPACSP